MAGQIDAKIAHVPVKRSYPKNEKTPTKIKGFGGKMEVLANYTGCVWSVSSK